MFIVIDPKTLKVSVAKEPPTSSALVIAAHDSLYPPDHSKMYDIVYYDVLYAAVYREDERKGITDRAYSLFPPDPWLVAVAAIMWEGIVQGLSYDVVKALVADGLDTLRARDLAPSKTNSKNRTTTETAIRFGWTNFSKEGKKRREMFFDLKRTYEEMSETERMEVSKSLQAQAGTSTEEED